MDFLSVMSKHWLEIIVAIYFMSMVLHGYRKGFFRLAISATALLITIVAVKYMQPYVINWLKQETHIYETLKEQMIENLGLDTILDSMELTQSIQKADEWRIIEELPIPEQIKDLLTQNNNTEVYKIMGVEYFGDYVGGYIADLLLRIVVFAVLFLVVFLIIEMIMMWFDLVAKLPVISGINKLAGAALGGMQAAVYFWIAGIFVSLFSKSEIGGLLLSQISSSVWLSWLHEHNILAYFVLGVLRNICF